MSFGRSNFDYSAADEYLQKALQLDDSSGFPYGAAAARGATFQAISEGAAQSAFDVAANDHLPRLFAELRASDPPLSEFSAEDQERLRFIYLFTVRRLENV